MDQLKYDYSGNQLTTVTDSAPNTTSSEGGFIDGSNTGIDYDYDANGNLKLDNNKSITSITYNYLNLPDVITKNNGDNVKYTYDATGAKLAQLVTPSDANNPPKLTDYTSGMVYENGVLQFIAHDEGRAVMKPLAANENGVRPEYQYHLKDHLGNTRLTFTTQADADVTTATHETANLPTEHSQFLRYDDVRMINAQLFDHSHLDPSNTYTTFYSERLNGTPNEQHGLARSLSVMPGDTLDIEVWGKYVDVANANPSLQAFLASIASGTAAAGTIVDGSNYGTAAGNAFPFDDTFLDKQDDHDAGPKAFLNFLVFDRDYNHIDAKCGYKQLPNDAGEDGTGKDFKPINQRIIIDKPGYVYIYLSNDNVVLGGGPVEVYFDDFKVTHRKSHIVQSNDYYPFGLTFNSYTRENSVAQNYLYNGKEQINDLGLDWADYGARMYMPEIGRFGQVDKLSEAYHGLSPYNYVANNPVNSIDHRGDFIVSIHYKITEDVLKKYGYGNSASRIAWYSSMYADNPSTGILLLNNLWALATNLPTVTYAQPAGWSTKNSQNTHSPTESQRHSMEGDYETEVTNKQAQQRGREFGWTNILKAAKGGTIDKWERNSDEQKAFGVGIHALQDAEVHEGTQMKDHSIMKDMVLNKEGGVAFENARSISESAVLVTEMVNGKFTNIKDGMSLNISGMNKQQMAQVISAGLKSKKNIRYVNEN